MVFGLSNRVCLNDFTRFDEANNVYQHGQFSQALKTYKSMEHKTARTYYNMGNCAYKLNDYGRALTYWRRAEKNWVMFGKTELHDNIDLLHQKVLNRSKPAYSFIRSVSNLIISLFTESPLIVLQIIFLALWLFLCAYFRNVYKYRLNSIICLLFIITLVFGSVLVMRYTTEREKCAVIISKRADVLSGPSKSFQKLGQLCVAHEVRIYKKLSHFYRIQNGHTSGWIDKKHLKII